MLYILWFLLIGLVVGWIARALHPGEEPGGWLATLATGIIGSFIGGGIMWLFQGGSFAPAGLLMSILGGVIFCWVYAKYNLGKYIPLDRLDDFTKIEDTEEDK